MVGDRGGGVTAMLATVQHVIFLGGKNLLPILGVGVRNRSWGNESPKYCVVFKGFDPASYVSLSPLMILLTTAPAPPHQVLSMQLP